MIKSAILSLISGLLAGALVLGVGGRIVMSLIVWREGLPAAWTLGGTLDVVLFGMLIGAGVGLVYGILRRALPGSRLAQGLFAGLLLFGIMAVLPPASSQTAMAGFSHRLPSILLMFGVLCLLFGIALTLTVDMLAKQWEQRE